MKNSSRYWLGAILVVAVLLRVLGALYMGDSVEPLPGTFDQVSYHNLALRVLNGHGFTFDREWWPGTRAGEPTAHWSYLYTLYLAAVYWLFGPHPFAARLIQAVIVGLLHPYLAYRLGQRVFGKTVGLIAAAFTAVYIYFVYYAATLMTEPFYITAILGGLSLTISLTYKRSNTRMAALLGISLGVAVLLRQLFLLFIPILFLWMWWTGRHQQHRPPLRAIAIAAVFVILMILPFTAYNYTRFDRFVLLNTNAGFAFFWGNHPVHGTRFILASELDTYQQLIPEELRALDEASLERELTQRGLQFVRQDPARFLLLSLSRIPPYFRFWPSTNSSTVSNVSRVASFGILLPFMVLGLIRAIFHAPEGDNRNTRFTSPSALLYLFMFSYTAIHVLTWTLIRYRLPIDAVLILFAAFAVSPAILFMRDRRELKQILAN